MAALVWIGTSNRPTPMSWGPVSGVYGEETDGIHRFRWMDTPAEIAVWSPSAREVSIAGEWRCGFHSPESFLEPEINGQPLAKMRLGPELQRVTWPAVPLKSGRNILRFVSSSGHEQISAQDIRVVAVGVRDLQVNHPETMLHRGDCWFFLGIGILAFIGWRVSVLLGFRQVDALGAGLLGAFGSLSASATALSTVHALTGTTWIAALVVLAAGLMCVKKGTSPGPEPMVSLTGWQVLLLLLPALMVGVAQILSPITKYDDLMYHGSRAGYWLGNRSVFPFLSHNERQEVFPYAGDLLFAFGVFSSHGEVPGKIAVFLAYPGILLLTAGLLLKRGLPRGMAIGTAWAVGVAPLVRDAAIGIKPDLWGLVFTLVAINAAWDIWHEPQSPRRRIHAAIVVGAICAAVAIKTTFLLLLPVALVPLIRSTLKERVQLLAITLGCLLAFGLVVTFAHNLGQKGGWLGSPAMMAVHRPAPGAVTMERHLARLPFLIFGLPWVPSETLRHRLNQDLASLADSLGATKVLPSENSGGWPGVFTVTVPEFNRGYSMLWLIGIAGTLAAIANINALRSDRDARSAAAILLLGTILILGVACGVRWQSHSGIPDRLLVPGMAVFSVGAAWWWYHGGFRHRGIRGVLAALLLAHAVPFLHESRLFLVRMRNGGMATDRGNSVLSPAAAVVPPGSRVLLFASQSSGDYVLFHPEFGFPTTVIPWGRRTFSESDFASELTHSNPDFVVFEEAEATYFHWDDPLPLHPFIQYLEKTGRFRLVPGGAPNLIYKRHGNSS